MVYRIEDIEEILQSSYYSNVIFAIGNEEINLTNLSKKLNKKIQSMSRTCELLQDFEIIIKENQKIRLNYSTLINEFFNYLETTNQEDFKKIFDEKKVSNLKKKDFLKVLFLSSLNYFYKNYGHISQHYVNVYGFFRDFVLAYSLNSNTKDFFNIDDKNFVNYEYLLKNNIKDSDILYLFDNLKKFNIKNINYLFFEGAFVTSVYFLGKYGFNNKKARDEKIKELSSKKSLNLEESKFLKMLEFYNLQDLMKQNQEN